MAGQHSTPGRRSSKSNIYQQVFQEAIYGYVS